MSAPPVTETLEPPGAAAPRARGLSGGLAVALLLLLCAWLFFFQLGQRSLWDIDEGMHATTSRVIVESGDWVMPTFNGEPFLDKPIFHNWLISICFLLFGFTELAARLPAALLGTGVVLLTYLVGRRMFGVLGGFLGAAVLATSLLHVLMSRVVVHDISLMFFVTAALAAFHAAYRQREPGTWVVLAFWIAVGFSFLAKGPVGPVLVALPMAVLLYRDRRWRFLGSMWPVRGVLIAALVALPWNLAMMLRPGDYGWHFFVEKNVLGFLSGKHGDLEPPLFYVPVLVVGMLPWTAFLPIALSRAFREEAGPRREELVFLLTWSLSVFSFFTLATAKLPTYVLPALPPLALLVGWCWREVSATPERGLRRAFRMACVPPVVLFGAAMVVFWFFPPQVLEIDLGIPSRAVAILLTALFGLSVLALGACWTDRFGIGFGAHLGFAVCVLTSFTSVFAPHIDPYRSTRELALAMDAVVPPGEPLVMWRGLRESAHFYTGRNMVDLIPHEEFLAYVERPEQVYFLLARDDRDELAAIAPDVFVVAEYGDAFVLSNREGELPLPDGSTRPCIRLGELSRLGGR